MTALAEPPSGLKRLRSLLKIAPESFSLDINLLVTRRCNFECQHCMTVSSPRMPAQYMTRSVFSEINLAVQDMRQELALLDEKYEHVQVTYNLVGGEPTLDMDKFGDLIRYIHQEGHSLEMTTNGWWLGSAETLTSFVRALGPVAYDDNVSIRISDSPYHDKFRTKAQRSMLDVLRKNTGADALYEIEEILMEDADVQAECPACSCKFESAWSHVEECQNGVTEGELHGVMDAARERVLPCYIQRALGEMLSSKSCGLHVDVQDPHGGDKISPVGRARDNNLLSACQDGQCGPHSDLRFTFAPDGSIYDFCCNGGKVAGGHARDGAQLLYNHLDFMTMLFREFPDPPGHRRNTLDGARCASCHKVARRWKERQTKWQQ